MLAFGVIWVLGAVAIYWNARNLRLLPSNDHVRVVAALWPLVLGGVTVWGLWRSGRYLWRSTVVDTAVSFQRVVDWRYNHGRILAARSVLDEQAERDARDEVEQLAPERDDV